MEDNSSPQEYPSQHQQPEHIIRQNYSIEVEGGRTFVIPNTFWELNCCWLTRTSPIIRRQWTCQGVSGGFLNVVGRKLMYFICLVPTQHPILIEQPRKTKKLYNTPIGGTVEARVDPVSLYLQIIIITLNSNLLKGHSEHERTLLHAEVKALQTTLDISYKNAAH